MKTNEVLVFFKEQGVCEIFKFKSLLGLNISLIPMYESTSRIAGPNVLLTFSISAFNRGKSNRFPLWATIHTGELLDYVSCFFIKLAMTIEIVVIQASDVGEL